MSIIETMARGIAKQQGVNWDDEVVDEDEADDFRQMARAALRAIKPEDVSDGMVAAAFRASDLWPAETQYINGEPGTLFRRAIAAALSAGAEQ